MKTHTIFLLFMTLLSSFANAQDRSGWNENTWTNYLVSQRDDWEGQYRTPDGSCVDVISPTHAYEVDWAEKWKEGIGQGLFYGIATERKPGLILLIRDWKTDRKYYLRALSVCGKYEIQLIAVEAKP